MNGNTMLLTLLMGLVGMGPSDFNSERAAVLVTGAEMSDIHRGTVEGYFGDALFLHQKLNAVERTDEKGENGFFAFMENKHRTTKVKADYFQLREESGKSGLHYVLPVAGFFEKLAELGVVIPTDFHAFERGAVSELDVRAVDHLKGYGKSYFILERTTRSAENDPKAITHHFPTAKRSYLLEFGPRDRLAETIAQLKGFQGGEVLYGRHYGAVPLEVRIHLSKADGDGKDEDALEPVRGWHLVWHHTQSEGFITRQGGNAVARDGKGPRTAPTIPASAVKADASGAIDMEVDAESFIRGVLAPHILPEGAQAGAGELHCLIPTSERGRALTACKRLGEGKGTSHVIRGGFPAAKGEKTKEDGVIRFWVVQKDNETESYRIEIRRDLRQGMRLSSVPAVRFLGPGSTAK